MYIPDMTERFPEGINGEDCTSDYSMDTSSKYEPTFEERQEMGEQRAEMEEMAIRGEIESVKSKRV